MNAFVMMYLAVGVHTLICLDVIKLYSMWGHYGEVENG